MQKCKECNAVFDSLASFHGHLRKHKLKVKNYYEKHHPMQCLQTGKKLAFKEGDTLEKYLSRKFIDKIAINQFFDEVSEEKRNTLFEIVEDSYLRQNILPCQTELASLPISPTLLTVQKYISLNELCKIGNYSTRFDYNLNYDKPLPITKIESKDFTINVDSREREPLRFYQSIVGKLDFGDYAIAGRHYTGINIERKSVGDFGSTLVGGLERFVKELIRVRDAGKYLIILVEFNLHEIWRHKFYGYSRPELVCHNLRGLIRDYSDVCQFCFGNDRQSCVQYIPQFLLCPDVRKYDLQLWVDMRKSQFYKHEFTEEDLNRLYDNS